MKKETSQTQTKKLNKEIMNCRSKKKRKLKINKITRGMFIQRDANNLSLVSTLEGRQLNSFDEDIDFSIMS